jgi:hypothetical protein
MIRHHASRILYTAVAAFVLVAALAVGCAGGDKPASASGHVTYNGKPVTSGTVVLVAPDGKTSNPGPVQPDGTDSITASPAGTVKVVFDNPPPPRPTAPPGQKAAANDPEAKEKAEEAARYVPTPPKYKDPNQSGVTLNLKRGNNPNSDIVLQ